MNLVVAAALGAVPSIRLNNGVEMPMISAGTWQYDPTTATQVVKTALSVGINHIDTANDYHNQEGVGAGLKGVNRSSYFLTTKVPPQSTEATAFEKTTKDLEDNLDQLGLSYVDLVLVHFPPPGNTRHCSAMQRQWAAMEAFYAAGKARAIGVSNYCPSSLECILPNATVTPAVNQCEYHVGMSADPDGIKMYCDGKGIVLQAYSPLGDGTSDLITGPLVTGSSLLAHVVHTSTSPPLSFRFTSTPDIRAF